MLTDNPFLVMALIAALFSSVTSGIVGSYVVVKRIVFIAGSISHSVLGGMGVVLFLKSSCGWSWLHPLYGALVAAIASSLLMGWIHFKAQEREDTVIAALWAAGMAIGVIFVSLTPGYTVELTHFLFGNILWVSTSDLWLLAFLGIGVLLVSVIFHRRFTTLCFDEEQVSLQGFSRKRLYLLLLCLTALSLVLLIQIVGALLVIALLAIPPAIAGMLSHRFHHLIILAVLLSALFSLLGIFAAYQLNWPPGATIAALSSLVYLASFSLRNKQRRIREEKND
ncbi:MAG: metal ABC transporter permease [Chlamydiae bacterium GWC2_50_10]|nr:MAG: metal ABC transporter permease [Chlamydiae bacterium GWA2_50_15]OGN53929.1 MAG: metal ABC transporter permease [Chlamydiae bacterium GWC2_50_10]OGN54669.1 MAG: metal ABC transporter permease [Chlamydiae bacterium GWF2_49_8]OGN57840.1 MAG: metal ABC transporter permease [Chlamydiae bacterium RIFCSPHIGHO2_02_FULL_49_29]OGN71837.1 MAG: metal ABC transporter permease [Chlamydiae bacterium RIFCSPLOWO2_02_FULL_49_12]OGN73605.1 MAG: metal ABC transporter permease [Chlamydiae bacterium RIFCSPL